jgi:hypothetical protein
MIKITNKKVVDFYQANPNISVDHVNLLLVDMMEKMVHDSVNASVVSQLMDKLTTIESDVKKTQEALSKSNPELLMQVSMKLMEMKKEYMEDVKVIMNTNVSERVAPLLKEYNGHLLDKTTLLFQDIPKTQDLTAKLQESIRDLQKSIVEESRKVSGQQSVQDFLNSLDQKFNTTQLLLTSSYEKMNSGLSEIKVVQDQQIGSVKENHKSVQEMLRKMDNSSFKGKIGESLVLHILQNLYPSADLTFVGSTKETGDFILERRGKNKILIENKNWDTNVPRDEVEKFMRDTATQNCCGLFLSQHTGIANKENFEINIHEGNVLMYIHHVNNDADLIKVAIDILDHFKEQLDEIGNDKDLETMPKEILDKINEEYNGIKTKKMAMLKHLKDFQMSMSKEIESIEIPTLKMYLSSRYASADTVFNCENCTFTAPTKQSMSAHKRHCKKNLNTNMTA